MRVAQLGNAYALAGKKPEAQKILDELKEQAKQRDVRPGLFALIYMGLGEKDLAIAALQRQYEDNPAGMPGTLAGREWDSLRSDPRFIELLRRLKLTE